MASKSAILAVKIIGDAKSAVDAMGKTGLAAGAVGAAVVAAGAVVGKGLYDIGAQFDEVADTIAVGTGASGEALDGLVDSAKNVGTQVPVEFDAAGEAISSLNTYLGATGKPLEDMTANVLDASRMLGEEGAANADAFGQAMSQWSRPAEDGADVLDTLFLSTQKYGVGLGDAIGNLNTYGSVLQNAGFTMEESASLFGQLESGGIAVSRVMPGLNKSFRDWASEGKDVQAELGNTVDAIENASSSTEALAIATDVFGAEGAQRMTTAIRSGKFELDDLAGALDGAGGSIAATSETTRSAGEEFDLLVNNATAALEPLGSIVFGLFGDAFGALADWIGTVDFTPIEQFASAVGDALPGLATGFGDLVSGASPLTGILDQIWPILQTIAGAVEAALPTIMEFGSTVLPIIAGAVAALIPVIMQVAATALPAILGVVQTVLPIVQGIISTVVPAIIGAVQTLVPLILGLIPPIMSIVGTVLSILGPAIQWLLPIVIAVFQNVVTIVGGAIKVVTGILTAVAALLRGDFSAAWDAIKGVVSTVIETVREVVNNGLNFVREHFSGAIEYVKEKVSAGFQIVVDTVSTKIGDVVSFVKELPGRILDGLGNLGDLLLGSGKALMDGLAQGIKDGIGNAIGAASDAVSAIRDFFPFSPAKRGPFSGSGYTDRSGKALVNDFAKAMTSEISTVTRAAGKVATAGTFEGGFSLNGRPTGAGGSARPAPAPQHVHVHIDGAFVGDRIGLAREIEALLSDRRVLVGEAA